MTEITNENIDVALKYLYSKNEAIYFTSLYAVIKINDSFLEVLSNRMKILDLVTRDHDVIEITKHGIEVSSYGGWIKYLENLADKEKRANEKLTLDLKQAKRQVKFFYPLLIFSIITGTCGVISLLVNTGYINLPHKIETGQPTKASTPLSLSQTKTVDSTHNSKNEIQKAITDTLKKKN